MDDSQTDTKNMLSSVSYEVQFRVKVATNPGEILCIVGNCPELGNWEPQKAAQLRRETKCPTISSGSNGLVEDHGGDIWSKTVVFSGSADKKYRYFIGRLLQSDNEDEELTVIVSKWETNIQPRLFSVTDAVKGKQVVDVAQFGNYGGSTHISKGWLIDQTHICINLHKNPIKMWNSKTRDQLFSVKCTAIDHNYAHVLEKGKSLQRPQGQFGAIYYPDSFMTFDIQTTDPEHTGFQLDFYQHTGNGDDSQKDNPPKHIGYSFILPLDLELSRNSKKVPINGFKHKPIGELKIDYLLIKPMLGKRFDMVQSYQNFWKSSRKALDIGHKGLGTSHGQANPVTKLAPVTENSIQSLMDAASHGADFVEIDVMLTKDKEVIVFHNFTVHISYKKKMDVDLELIPVPLHELKLAELQKMKVWHSAEPDHATESSNKDEVIPENQEPFPTLEKCFESVDLHTGFQIEIKYPQSYKDGAHEMKHFTDLNEFVDRVLHVVFKHHGGRRIIFSCFDPDVCIALSLKQNQFPVLFLTQANTTTYALYEGLRTQSVQMATEFCLCYGLLGVNAMSEVLLKDQSLIKYVKESGLILFCWGEDNNNFDIIHALKQQNLDGIIYDRIDHFKTSGKESIFKLEKAEKLRVLETFGQHESDPITVNTPDAEPS